jgi:hypothetical protein
MEDEPDRIPRHGRHRDRNWRYIKRTTLKFDFRAQKRGVTFPVAA